MAAYDTIKKVKLKDPKSLGSSAAILYPVTGINAIMAGTSGDAATTYIVGTGSGTQIQPQYLAIINSSGYVDDTYLQFMDDGKILDKYLRFIDMPAESTGQPKISQDYLPSYVDDVVDVPVVNAPNNADSAAYQLEIQMSIVEGVKAYTFKKWNGTQWVEGGGEASKIYIAATAEGVGDGSIYRCKSGSTTQAIKISENPYVISTDKTNGVWIDSSGNTLSAKAQLANNTVPGTVIIDTTVASPTNNVALSISNGTVSVAALTASPSQAGIVFAVGTEADYNLRTSAHGDMFVVPTAKWTREMISSGMVGISLATYNNPGIVQIASTGHINVSSGIISVPTANASIDGVVKIVDTIDTAVTGNASKAVTQGGIVSYVTSALNGYQTTLSGGSGILISGGFVNVRTGGDCLTFDIDGNLIANAAAATTLGTVLITGDSSYIENGSSTIDGKPIAVNPVAVSNYIDATFASRTVSGAADLNVSGNSAKLATVSAISGFVTSAIEGLDPISGGVAINVDDGTVSLLYDSNVVGITNNSMTISSATGSTLGIVKPGAGLAVQAGGVMYTPQITTAAEFAVASNSSKLATVSAISEYVDSAVAGLDPVSGGVATEIDANDQINVLFDSNVMTTVNNSLTVSTATNAVPGVAKFPSSSGLVITNGAVTLQTAGIGVLGGVKTASNNTGIAVTDAGQIYAQINTNMLEFDNSNKITVKTATTSQGGIVKILESGTDIDVASHGSAVPVASAVKEYVSTFVTGAKATVTAGAGIYVSSATTGNATDYKVSAMLMDPLVLSGTSIGIRTASATVDDAYGSSMLGAVYIRSTVRSAFTSTTQHIADSVPTDSAVRAALNALPYITYEEVTY